MLAVSKPRAEVLVEGELSPFEHEALYQILKKKFLVDQPGYAELPDEDLTTRVNIVFHHSYSPELFTTVLQESWRDLKELLKQVRRRRGKVGAAFNFTFAGSDTRLVFRSGALDYEAMGSALDQIGHLTGIVRQMQRPGSMSAPLGVIECSFDKVSDRWHRFLGFSATDRNRVYSFDELDFKWTLHGP